MNAEFREDVLDMMSHRMRAQIQLLRDLSAARTAREKARDLRFTSR
jgi:hypothetical protein